MIHPSIHSFKTKSVSWFAACSLFMCGLLVFYVIWYNLYMLVYVCVIFLFSFSVCISLQFGGKSWNQNLLFFCNLVFQIDFNDFDDRTLNEDLGISLSIDVSFVRIVLRCIKFQSQHLAACLYCFAWRVHLVCLCFCFVCH